MKESVPAFPVNTGSLDGHQTGVHTWQYPGMTLRDYFAAKVLPTLMTILPDQTGRTVTRAEFAYEAYKYADAMLAERAK